MFDCTFQSHWTMLINQWQALDGNSTLSGTKICSQSTEPSRVYWQSNSLPTCFFFFAWDPGWDWVYFYVRNILSIYFLFKRGMKWECDSLKWFKTDWTDIPVPGESSLALTGAWMIFLCLGIMFKGLIFKNSNQILIVCICPLKPNETTVYNWILLGKTFKNYKFMSKLCQ